MLRKIYRAIVPLCLHHILRRLYTFPSQAETFRKCYDERGIKYSFTFLFLDWAVSHFVVGASPDDYFAYRFYEKNLRGKSQFVTEDRLRFLNYCLNLRDKPEEELRIMGSKSVFDETFMDYTKRRIMYSENLSWESFREFLREMGHVIIKPSSSGAGKGIYILRADDDESEIARAYNSFASRKHIIEEVLEQDGLLREVNPGTLNTIRINVLNINGRYEIQNAALRTGQGSRPVDNISAGGLVSAIDVETGTVVSLFCDKLGRRLLRHPLTGTMLIGRKIPAWEKAKAIVLEGARRISSIYYTAWDLAVIKNEEVAVIECNTGGGFINQQSIEQVGLWKHYRECLKEIQSGRN
ncbi:MAG: hypothetical protein IJR63_00655 [Synergistaceae bacterium]|nr:hypothetical protein [Synergistaceae bacterium]